MSSTLHTFIDIFHANFGDEENVINISKVEIPIIQRDYAQGRDQKDIQRIRDRFLDALFEAVEGSPITLDFVYGNVKDNGVMTPLDGQQRLTTLYLLHWYASKRCNAPENECNCLKMFSYETRFSARAFCQDLVNFAPDFTTPVAAQIRNQSWFPLEWKKDPTISAMLTMIDAIVEKFAPVQDLWQKLKSGKISFYFLPIQDMGLTDELYIKMNSRGKPLTNFEHFKAELEKTIRNHSEDLAKRIIAKIDSSWTDLLWNYRGDNNIIDDEFIRYFKFICSILYYKAGQSTRNKSSDVFDLLKDLFSTANENAIANIEFLESYFDCWTNLPDQKSPAQYLAQFMSTQHEIGKIISTPIDIFQECLDLFDNLSGINRKFTMGRTVLLYAVIQYLLKRTVITEDQFRRRLRSIQNLINNSSNELSDSEDRQGGNRLPATLKQVDSIILKAEVDLALGPNLNNNQLKEEKEKLAWTEANPSLAESLFILEDHPLLYGQIAIIGLENPELFPRFGRLFNQNIIKSKDASKRIAQYNTIKKALMTEGIYGQYNNKDTNQLGSDGNASWEALFHHSSSSGFEQTKNVLTSFITKDEQISTEWLNEQINSFIADREARSHFDFPYYYIKYDSFRRSPFGKYFAKNLTAKTYDVVVMRTEHKKSENSFQPFLYEADCCNINRADHGESLKYSTEEGLIFIRCYDNYFEIFRYSNGSNVSREKIDIPQNNGIDSEDRIIILRDWLKANGLKKN